MPRPHSPRRPPELVASATLFAALGDVTRLRIAFSLSDHGSTSITKLTAGFTITRQAVTKHLRVMEDAGLVRGIRRGRESVWQLEASRFADVRRYLDRISKDWDQALGRLKGMVER